VGEACYGEEQLTETHKEGVSTVPKVQLVGSERNSHQIEAVEEIVQNEENHRSIKQGSESHNIQPILRRSQRIKKSSQNKTLDIARCKSLVTNITHVNNELTTELEMEVPYTGIRIEKPYISKPIRKTRSQTYKRNK